MPYLYKAHEHQIIAAVKRAHAEGKLEIAMPQVSNAIAMRAQVYALGKKLRKLGENDPTVFEVSTLLDNISMRLDKSTLVVERKDATPTMLALGAALAKAGVKVEDPNAKLFKESEERLARRLADAAQEAAGAQPPRTTPYYTREK